MTDSLAGIVLAAGAGTRLFPLTLERPKPLCPVAGTALVDRAIAALAPVVGDVAVNAHHGAAQLVAHLEGRVRLSVEDHLLGTGGAIGRLKDWVAGRAVIVHNADTVHDADLGSLLDGWDGQRIRALVAGPAGTPFAPGVRLVAVLHPWEAVAGLPAERCSLHQELWWPWHQAGRLEVVTDGGPWFDCGTPASYLAANLWASGGVTVVGAGAVVRGEAVRCVLWEGCEVRPGERLVDAVRTSTGRTVLVR